MKVKGALVPTEQYGQGDIALRRAVQWLQLVLSLHTKTKGLAWPPWLRCGHLSLQEPVVARFREKAVAPREAAVSESGRAAP